MSKKHLSVRRPNLAASTLSFFLLEYRKDSLNADGDSDSRDIFAAKHSHESVVASAAADGANLQISMEEKGRD